MRLSALIDEGLEVDDFADVEVGGIALKAQAVRPGDLFAALPGVRVDGRRFAAEAAENGAVAFLTAEAGAIAAGGRPVVRADEPRGALARMAARLHPGRPAFVAAVTGTNGKTSIAGFTRQLWRLAGLPAASLGTLGLEGALVSDVPALTTPDAVALHRALELLKAQGIEHLALEASSHGLDQRRLDGLEVDAAAFSNLSRDHFDYHGTYDAYLAAKRRLFTDVLRPDGTAVLNADAPESAGLADAVRARGGRVWTYGAAGADGRLVARVPHAVGQRLALRVDGVERGVEIALVGGFQAHNLLAALGLAIAGGLAAERALDLLPEVRGVRGRMERVRGRADGTAAYVDYAHTPDALEQALKALRPHTDGRLHVVFGCGGDRDPGKRPLMGSIAAKLADRVWLTDDNPRGEDPALIRAAVRAGIESGDAVEIGDRAGAIAAAFDALEPGDTLLVAGKGHETGQTVGDTVHPFDDAAVLRALPGDVRGAA